MVYDKVRLRNIILIAAIALLLLAGYIKFFHKTNCDDGDRQCFNTALARCSRATFTNYGADLAWYYNILGEQKDSCIVYVENVNFKTAIEAAKLKGKGMECSLPLGVVTSPESNIDLCNGILKEELQDIIIQKMHLYIVQNLGSITEAFEKPL